MKNLIVDRTLAFFGILLISGFIHGQTDEDEKIFVLDPFVVEQNESSYIPTSSVVASGFAIENIKNPITVSSLTERFVDDLKFDDLGDAAGYISGTVKSPGSDGTFHGTRIIVRGFNTTWFNRNGIRRYVINGTDNLSRLEVIKGPAAVFFGQAAPGGVLNYVTHRPEFVVNNSLEVRYGSYDYSRVEVTSQGPIFGSEKWAYRINSSYLDKKDWRDFEWQERSFGYGGLLWQPTKQLKIYAEYERIKDENNDALALPQGNPVWMKEYLALNDPGNPVVDYYTANPGEISMPGGSSREDVLARLQGRWRSGGSGGNARWRDDSANALGIDPEEFYFFDEIVPEATPFDNEWNPLGPGGLVKHDLENYNIEGVWSPTEWFSLRATAIWDNAYRRGFLHNNQRFDMSPEGPIFSGQINNLTGLFNETLTLVANGVFRFTTGFAEHTILIGADKFEDDFLAYDDVDGTTSNVSGSWNYFTDGYHEQSYGDSKIFVTGLNHRNIRKSKYVNYVLRLWNERVVLMGGVRDENFERLSPSDDGLNTILDLSEVTPSFGAVIEIVEGLNFYASRSKSFNANSGVVPARVNTNLDSEERARYEDLLGGDRYPNPATGEGYDIGFKASLMDDKLNGSLSYYNVQEVNRFGAFSEELTFDDPRNADYLAANPDAQANQLPVLRNEIFGETTVRGIELEGIYQPIPEWNILLSYTRYLEASAEQADGTELRMIATPDHRVSLWNRYDFKDGPLNGFSFGVGAVYSDEFLTRPLTENKRYIADSYIAFDALVEYDWELSENTTLQLTLNVRNVTDEIYFGGGVGSPSDVRKFIFTAKINF